MSRLGTARVPRSRTFPKRILGSAGLQFQERLFRRDAETSTRDACAAQTALQHKDRQLRFRFSIVTHK